MQEATKVRLNTRIAPSPTGDMHFGTARTALFNFLAARATGGTFTLRIDDTDTNRNRKECVDVIVETLDWLGMEYDARFHQSDRTTIYREFSDTLLKAGLAKELDNGAVALKWFERYGNMWNDMIVGNTPITQTNIDQIDGKLILMKGKPRNEGEPDFYGMPTYQFASVVDDWSTDINCIIRGNDHFSNTAKQIAIWSAINDVLRSQGQTGKPLPQFAHVGLIFKDGKKMSKRDNAASMLHYKNEGYTPDALLNFMLRLGWGGKHVPDTPIPLARAINLFMDGRMKATNIGFDGQKLEYFRKFYDRNRKAAA